MIIRKGLEKDRSALKELLEEFNMHGDVPPEEFLVAEEDGAVAGVVRLERIENDVYLRAMAVHSDWHGRGVGSRLVRELVAGLDQVKVVARGYAAPFYEKLGFKPVDWSVIHKNMSKECIECPDVLTCKPVPMVYERTANGQIEM
jgi:N-acetylglutamate synthase-like GNAT family acetyltransferase